MQYDYDEYGNPDVLVGADFGNEVCYTGQIYDQNTGLYYYNARYYDPEIGRFTTQDTYRGDATDPSTYHLYEYCGNDPINGRDPSGHKILWDKNETFKRIGKRYSTRSYGFSNYGYTAVIKIRNRYRVTEGKGLKERVKKSKIWVSTERGGGRVKLGKLKSSRHYTKTKGESINVYAKVTVQIIPDNSGAAIASIDMKLWLYIKLVRKKRYGVYIKAGYDWEYI